MPPDIASSFNMALINMLGCIGYVNSIIWRMYWFCCAPLTVTLSDRRHQNKRKGRKLPVVNLVENYTNSKKKIKYLGDLTIFSHYSPQGNLSILYHYQLCRQSPCSIIKLSLCSLSVCVFFLMWFRSGRARRSDQGLSRWSDLQISAGESWHNCRRRCWTSIAGVYDHRCNW